MKKDRLVNILYKLIYPTSLYFTVITLIFYATGTILDYGNLNLIPTLRTELIILGFSFIINLANLILYNKKLHISLRIALHYLITAVGFFVLFITASSYKPGTSFTIVIMLAYTLVYAVICSVITAVTSAKRKKKIESSEYKPIYDKRI